MCISKQRALGPKQPTWPCTRTFAPHAAALTAGVGGVKDDAVLSVVERRDVDDADDLLVDVRDVRLGVGHLDEPLLAVLAHHAEVVFERAQ